MSPDGYILVWLQGDRIGANEDGIIIKGSLVTLEGLRAKGSTTIAPLYPEGHCLIPTDLVTYARTAREEDFEDEPVVVDALQPQSVTGKEQTKSSSG